jgi:DNA-directed RNA polymerase subunit beta'
VNPIFCMVLRRPWLGRTDPSARRHARPDGQAVGQDHRNADQGELPRRPAVLEYFSSTHGARKGLADTALKTADSGYLTRKLADVAQNVVVTMRRLRHDPGHRQGPPSTRATRSKSRWRSDPRPRGCVPRSSTDHRRRRSSENEVITVEIAKRIEALGYEKIRVRSPLTCEASIGVCALCYGMDLSRGELVEDGLAVGIIAAQSIGEPGTQLTMRTFHIGGTASKQVEAVRDQGKRPGVSRQARRLEVVNNGEDDVVALAQRRNPDRRQEGPRTRPTLRSARRVLVVKGQDSVKAGQRRSAKWDPHHNPILADRRRRVRYEDIVEGKTITRRTRRDGRAPRKVIIEHKGDLHPQIVIEDEKGNPSQPVPDPGEGYIEVENGAKVAPARCSPRRRANPRHQDITGGLPRVTELFEARRPKDPAGHGRDRRHGRISATRSAASARSSSRAKVASSKSTWCRTASTCACHRRPRRAGEALVDGPLVPHDILRINGEEARPERTCCARSRTSTAAQGVSDRRQAHRDHRVADDAQGAVDDPGDSDFLPGVLSSTSSASARRAKRC